MCLTLHGQTTVWGRVAEICYDGLRLREVQILSDLDTPGPFAGETPPGRQYPETLIHLNQILAVTCLDDDLPEPSTEPSSHLPIEKQLLIEPVELHLGSELAALVSATPNSSESSDPASSQSNSGSSPAGFPGSSGPQNSSRASLADRLERLRAQLATELGLLIAPVPVREQPRLPSLGFLVRLRGVAVAHGQIEPGKLLAVENPQAMHGSFTSTATPSETPPAGLQSSGVKSSGVKSSGVPTGTSADVSAGVSGSRGRVCRAIAGKPLVSNPFPHPAVWITLGQREQAELYGYTVLSPEALLVAYLHDLFRLRAADLFGRQQLEELLDQVRFNAPAVVEEVVPDLLRPRQLQKILRGLLREAVPIRDLETILETLSEAAYETTEIDVLVERTRQALSSALTDRFRDLAGRLHAVTLEPALESALARLIRRSPRGPRLELSSAQQAALVPLLQSHLEQLRRAGRPEVLMTTPPLRPAIRALIAVQRPHCAVLSHHEVEAGTAIEVSGVVIAGKLFDSEKRTSDKRTDKKTPIRSAAVAASSAEPPASSASSVRPSPE